MARTWSAVLARLGVPTGDGRVIPPGSLTSRELPLPLSYQAQSSDGHGGSVVVGRIESVSFSDGMVTATGSMLDAAYGTDVMELLEAGVIGPSVDLDDVDYVVDDMERVVITQGRVAGATLVAIPAFEGVHLTLDPLPAEPMDEPGVPVEPMPSLYASAAPAVLPPLDWFAKPDVDRLTPLTVSDTGRVFGHIAPWGECHVGLPGCVTAPSSATDYAYFHQGSQAVEGGARIATGTLTVGGGHAAGTLGWRPALEHYDNVGTAVAKVVAGEDEHGIWVAGWMLPEATAEQREAFLSSPVSGDWRQVGGSLEMIAVCSVVSAGFPVPRARVSFGLAEGQRSLVACFGIIPQRPAEPPTVDTEILRARWAWQAAQ